MIGATLKPPIKVDSYNSFASEALRVSNLIYESVGMNDMEVSFFVDTLTFNVIKREADKNMLIYQDKKDERADFVNKKILKFNVNGLTFSVQQKIK